MENRAMTSLSRRSFLKTAAATAGAAALGTSGVALAAQESDDVASGEMQLAGYSCCTFASCGNCLHEVYVRDGKVVKTDVWQDNPAGEIPCLRGRGAILQRTYGPRRLQYPMRRVEGTARGAGEWERITWDEAMADIKEHVGGAIRDFGSKSVLWATGNGSQAVFGTENCDFNSRMLNILGWTKLWAGWDDNFAAGIQSVVGGPIFMGPGAVAYPPTGCSIHIGSNRGPVTPYLWDEVIATKESGVPIVVVDPVFTRLANVADLWVNLRPGSDTILWFGVLNRLFTQGREAADFLARYTVAPILVRKDNGRFLRMSDVDGTERAPEDDMGLTGGYYFLISQHPAPVKSPDAPVVWDADADAPGALNEVANPEIYKTVTVNGIECTTALQLLKDRVAEYDLAKVCEMCELTEATADAFIEYFLMPSAEINYMYGSNWYWNSYEAGRALATAEAVAGKIMPPGYQYFAAFNEGYFTCDGEFEWAYALPQDCLEPVLKTGLVKGNPFPIKVLFNSGCGGFLQGADMNHLVDDILPMIDYIVAINIVSCDVTKYSDLVLPACGNYEKWDLITGSKYSDKIIDPLYECKEDFEIACMIGKLFADEKYFDKTKEEYAAEILNTPTLQWFGTTLEAIKEYHIMNVYSAFVMEEYETNTGRLEFYVDVPAPKLDYGQEFDFDAQHMVRWIEPLEAWPGSEAMQKHPFILMSTRHFWGYHTQYLDTEWVTEMEPEPTVRINPRDAAEYGIEHGDYVEVYNDRGHAVAKAVLSEGIRRGSLMYPKGWDSSQHKAGCWSELNRPERTPMGLDALLYDNCVSIRTWKEA